MTGKPHILIVEARFYEDIADELVKGATAVLKKAGAGCERVVVPGAFELPAAVDIAARSRRFDGFVALGCVIRGETTHYDHVCQECARGLQDVALRHGLALGFGVLTVENERQARVRADMRKGDHGGRAAKACLAMIAIKRRLAKKAR